MDDPKHIGRYEILGELGKGAMGKVYRAQDPNIGRIVALKTMRLDVHGTDDVEILRRFKHEAKLAGVLNHGNIVTIYDAGEFDGVFYMAMEYLEGSTLQTLLHNHRTLPPDRIVEISRQVCAGLDYAHSHNVIHRDVKPANIMMTGDNVVKIMDFGIAKSSANMTTTGQVLGTPTYMSPEQVRGKTLDGRSDLFSFGVVLYEMVVGEKPFTGQTITTIIYKIIHEQAIPPRELDVTVHPGISAVIMKALAKNPDERYQNGADLVRDLLNYKSVGTDTESTKMIAAVTPPAGAVAAAAAVRPPTSPAATPEAPGVVSGRGEMLEMAKAAPQPNIAPARPAVRRPGESTVGGIQMGKSAKVPLPPTNKNLKFGAIAAAVLLAAITIVFGLNKWQAREVASQLDTSAVDSGAPVPDNKAGETAVPASTAAGAKTAGATPGAKTSGESTGEKTAKPSAAITTSPTKTAFVPGATTSAAIPANKSNLQVSSEPAGAQVVVSGPTSASGTTPFTAAGLEPGNYSVKLSKAGYAPLTRSVRLMGGRATAVGANLKAEVGNLAVNSTPPGAEIFLDGKNTGKVTPATFPLASGEHKVEVKKSGYQEAETTTAIKSGQNHTFAPTLVAAKAGGNPFRSIRGMFGAKIPEGKGMVNFKTTPPGADIFHNGVKVGKQTPAKFPMDPGNYKVTIRKAGYKVRVHEFRVDKGKSVDVDVTLEKN